MSDFCRRDFDLAGATGYSAFPPKTLEMTIGQLSVKELILYSREGELVIEAGLKPLVTGDQNK